MSHSVEEVEKLKHAPSIPGVIEQILARWSPRAFSHKPVAAEDLKKIFDSLVEFNQGWAKSAPVLILSVASKTFAHNGSANHFAIHDTGAATAYIGLQATALGLHTHSMAGFDQEKARAAFGIPESFQIGAVTALGHLGDVESLPEGLREQELSPRKRKPLAEFVFAEWEKPAKL